MSERYFLLADMGSDAKSSQVVKFNAVVEVFEFDNKKRSRSPSPSLAAEILHYGQKLIKVDGALKTSTNKFIMRLNEAGEFDSEKRQAQLPSISETRRRKDLPSRLTPPPRRPPPTVIPRAESTPRFDRKADEETLDRLPSMRTRLQQKIYFTVLSKPRATNSVLKKPKKKFLRLSTSPHINKAIWAKSRLRQIRTVYEAL